MAKLADLICNYTGGGIYVVTAKYGDVYLATDLDPQSYGTYDIPYEDINDDNGYDYDGHWKDSAEPLPTWGELLDAIRDSYNRGISTNMSMGEVEHQIRGMHPDLSVRLDEPDPVAEPMDGNTDRLTTISEFIEAFEDFLDEKGIVIPNDEKEQDPESASNIYGTDYGNLSEKIESLLIRYGVLN